MMKIYERMFEASVRIENAWPFPVSPAPDSLAETLEFYDHALPPEIEALIKGWSDDEREELFSGMSGRFQDAYEELCAKAFRTQVSGWLGIAAVPVFTALDSGGGCSFSWGHYHTKLIFAAAADQLLIAACDWGEEDMRTGCVGCNLIAHDGALAAVLKLPNWDHLAPLLGLKRLYRELRRPANRKRQPGFQYRKDGTLQSNQQRMGPLTFEARLMGLERVLAIQAEVNADAERLGRTGIILIDAEEETRIRELIALETWPHGWTGDEPKADVWLDRVNNDGSVEPILFRDLVGS